MARPAAWAEDLARQCFAGWVSILDFYHACERLHKLAEALGQPKLASRWKKWLLKNRVASIISQTRQLQAAGIPEPDPVEEQVSFLERHQDRMHYGTYRKNGWFMGRGVIEAGCKTVVGKRLKQSGRFWSQAGATGVLDFRTLWLSRRFDAFWTDRANAQAARNDPLAFSA